MKKVELEHIKDKSHPFDVPEGYFQDLEKAILDATVDAPEEEVRSTSMWPRVPRWTLAAAASVLVVLSALLLLQGEDAYDEKNLLAGITDEEIMIYLADYELSEYDIVGDLSTEQLDELFEDEDAILDGLDVGDDEMDDLLLEYEALDETLEI